MLSLANPYVDHVDWRVVKWNTYQSNYNSFLFPALIEIGWYNVYCDIFSETIFSLHFSFSKTTAYYSIWVFPSMHLPNSKNILWCASLHPFQDPDILCRFLWSVTMASKSLLIVTKKHLQVQCNSLSVALSLTGIYIIFLFLGWSTLDWPCC